MRASPVGMVCGSDGAIRKAVIVWRNVEFATQSEEDENFSIVYFVSGEFAKIRMAIHMVEAHIADENYA